MTSNHTPQTLVDAWFALWSPGASAWNGEAACTIFATGDGAIRVVDDMGGTTLTLSSVSQYVETWTPFMAQFGSWTIAPVGNIEIMEANGLAVAAFTFRADATDANGTAIMPAPGQHATLVMRRLSDGWRIVREHLTGVAAMKEGGRS